MAVDLEREPGHEPMQDANGQSLTTLVRGIVGDAQHLLGQQLELFKTEVRDDLRKTKDAVVPLLLGGIIAFVGVVLLMVMVVHLLAWAFPAMPLWVAYAIVGGIFTAVGAVLVYIGKRQFSGFNPLPDETARALQENLQWLTGPR